jgi:hypothetical protein
MVASLTFLTPLGGLVVIAAALPLAAFVVGSRRVARIRSSLGLERAERSRTWTFVGALAAVPLLLGVVAMQPVWRTTQPHRVRSDAQAYVVIDSSRSMLASARRDSPTRFERAQADAIAIRNAIPEIPTGVGTMTDRVLPNLLPSPSLTSFSATVRKAVGIERPPPSSTGVVATNLGSLATIPAGGTFSPSAKKRAIVVLTDGESRPFDPGAVASALARYPGAKLELVHVWNPNEAIYDADGKPEGAYRPNPASTAALESLANATGGKVFDEGQTAAVAKAVRDALGSGPTVKLGLEPHDRALASLLALIALLPLGVVLWRRNLR